MLSSAFLPLPHFPFIFPIQKPNISIETYPHTNQEYDIAGSPKPSSMTSHSRSASQTSHSEHPECCFTGNLGFYNWDDASVQLKAVYHFLQGLRDWNFDMLEPTLSDEFRMEILPRSLGAPMRTREDWLRTCKESSILEPGYRVSTAVVLCFSSYNHFLALD